MDHHAQSYDYALSHAGAHGAHTDYHANLGPHGSYNLGGQVHVPGPGPGPGPGPHHSDIHVGGSIHGGNGHHPQGTIQGGWDTHPTDNSSFGVNGSYSNRGDYNIGVQGTIKW